MPVLSTTLSIGPASSTSSMRVWFRLRSRTKSSAIFERFNERSDHFSFDVVAVEAVQLFQPEVIAVKVQIGQLVRVSSQVTDVLHLDEGAIDLGAKISGL